MTIGRRRLLEALGVGMVFRPGAAFAEELLRHGAAPQNLATPTELFDRPITPTPSFFVRSHFGPPALDPGRPLRIEGLAERPLTITAGELERLPQATVTAVLQCAGNGRALQRPRVPGVQWVHGAMGQATFTGVRLKELLARVGAKPEAAHLHLRGADAPPKPTVPAFLRSIPLARALEPSTLVALRMNGEPLTLAHGAPLRLVVPGWAGDHWVKWLTHLTLAKEEAGGFFMTTAYRMPVEPIEPGAAPEKTKPATTFPVKSIIGAPGEGAKRPRGKQEIVGVAFSGEAPIAKVEVSVDDGKTWHLAKLEGESAVGRWSVFRYAFERTEAGRLTALVRATDGKGKVQPPEAGWNPSGYFWNAWHRVSWTVE